MFRLRFCLRLQVITEDALLESGQQTPGTFPGDFPFKEPNFPSGATYEKSDETRIENAFKRKDSSQTDYQTEFQNTEVKSSSSLHGISNPNYGNSPTSSKTSLDNFPFQMSVTPPHESQKINATRVKGTKKASLFAWMTLQSAPEETIISPHILEFLEQTLEPIPLKTNFSTTGNCYLVDPKRKSKLFLLKSRKQHSFFRSGQHKLWQLRVR